MNGEGQGYDGPAERRVVPGSEEAITEVLKAGRDQVLEAKERLDIDPLRLPTVPWATIHALTGPLWPHDLWMVAAATGSGKTTVLAHLVEWWLFAGKRVYFLALEQKPSELRTALAALALGLHPQMALENKWEKLPMGAKTQIEAELSKQIVGLATKLVFSPMPTLNVGDEEAEIQMAAGLGADVVILDHLGQVNTGGYLGLDRFLKGLKRAANDYGIPVVLAAQLNRGDKDLMRPYRPPTTYDLQGGEIIAQIASVVLGLYRPLLDTFSKDDQRAVLQGRKAMRDFVEPGKMGMVLMKHRLRGHLTGHRERLDYVNGRIKDPVTEQQTREEERYGL